MSKYNGMQEGTDAQKTAKVLFRNRILREYIWLIDRNYDAFEAKYYGQEASVNWVGDVLNLGLTGTASVAGGGATKAILAAIATGTTGIKTSYEKNFYDQQTRSAIVQKMRSLRATQLAILEDENHLKAGLEYDLQAGFNDVNVYYEQGTVIAALQSIAESSGVAASDAKKKQQQNSQLKQNIKVKVAEPSN